MVIISTRAVEVSIQAVSPEVISLNFTIVGSVGAAAGGVAALGAACAEAAGAPGASSAQALPAPAHKKSPSTRRASSALSPLRPDAPVMRWPLSVFVCMRMACRRSAMLELDHDASAPDDFARAQIRVPG